MSPGSQKLIENKQCKKINKFLFCLEFGTMPRKQQQPQQQRSTLSVLQPTGSSMASTVSNMIFRTPDANNGVPKQPQHMSLNTQRNKQPTTSFSATLTNGHKRAQSVNNSNNNYTYNNNSSSSNSSNNNENIHHVSSFSPLNNDLLADLE